MKLYNTLTRKKEEFIPLEEGKVKMYVCGPTVYNYPHIGNARPNVVFDILVKFLRYIGYKVKSINAMVYASYSVSDGFARVSLETHGGEEAKAIVENVLAQLPEDNPFKNAEISQGKKNKDKWAWSVLVSMDKNDSQLVQWYADNILNAYKAAGEI